MSSQLVFGITYLSADEVLNAEPVQGISIQVVDVATAKPLKTVPLEPSVAGRSGQFFALPENTFFERTALPPEASAPHCSPSIPMTVSDIGKRKGSTTPTRPSGGATTPRGQGGNSTPRTPRTGTPKKATGMGNITPRGGATPPAGGSPAASFNGGAPPSPDQQAATHPPITPPTPITLGIHVYKEAALIDREEISVEDYRLLIEADGDDNTSSNRELPVHNKCTSVSGTAGVQISSTLRFGAYPSGLDQPTSELALFNDVPKMVQDAVGFVLPLGLKLVQEELELAVEDAVLAEAKLAEKTLEKDREIDRLKRKLLKLRQKMQRQTSGSANHHPSNASVLSDEHDTADVISNSSMSTATPRKGAADEDDEVGEDALNKLLPDPSLAANEKEEELAKAHARVAELEAKISKQNDERRRIVISQNKQILPQQQSSPTARQNDVLVAARGGGPRSGQQPLEDRAEDFPTPSNDDEAPVGPEKLDAHQAFLERQLVFQRQKEAKQQRVAHATSGYQDPYAAQRQAAQKDRSNNTVKVYTTRTATPRYGGAGGSTTGSVGGSRGSSPVAIVPTARGVTPRTHGVATTPRAGITSASTAATPRTARTSVPPVVGLPSGSGTSSRQASPNTARQSAPNGGSNTYSKQNSGTGSAYGRMGSGTRVARTKQSAAEMRRLESIQRMEQTIQRLNKAKSGKGEESWRRPTKLVASRSGSQASDGRNPQPRPAGRLPTPTKQAKPVGSPIKGSPAKQPNLLSPPDQKQRSGAGTGGAVPPIRRISPVRVEGSPSKLSAPPASSGARTGNPTPRTQAGALAGLPPQTPPASARTGQDSSFVGSRRLAQPGTTASARGSLPPTTGTSTSGGRNESPLKSPLRTFGRAGSTSQRRSGSDLKR